MAEKKERKRFYIEVLLEERGDKAEFARELGVTQSAINHFFDAGAITSGTRRKYTEAYNRFANTNLTKEKLFSLVE